jgi:hypothetical protein
MSSLIAAPELITTAATDLANIGSAVTAANGAAATQTTGVLAAPRMRCRRPLPRCSPPTVRAFRHSVRRRRHFAASLCRR